MSSLSGRFCFKIYLVGILLSKGMSSLKINTKLNHSSVTQVANLFISYTPPSTTSFYISGNIRIQLHTAFSFSWFLIFFIVLSLLR